CTIEECRSTFRERRGHHQVLGTRDRRKIEDDLCAAQSSAVRTFRDHVSVLERDLAGHRFETFEMLIDRTRADRATSRKRNFRTPITSDERSQNEDARTHLFDELVRSFGTRASAHLFESHFRRIDGDLASEKSKQRCGSVDIAKLRYVSQTRSAVRQ